MLPQPRPVNAAGRKRTMLGATLFILGLAALAAWLWSGWRWFGYRWSQCHVQISSGLLSMQWLDDDVFPQIDQGVQRASLPMQPRAERWQLLAPSHGANRAYLGVFSTERIMHLNVGTVTHSTQYTLAFWPLPALFLPPAVLLLCSSILTRRRAAKGLCQHCGYNLAGLSSGSPCPECGKTSPT